MYVDPTTVVSPKASWTLIKVLKNGETNGKGDDDAALALGKWDDFDGSGPSPVFAARWNGSSETSGVGNPQSRGLPTWFIIPWWMNDAILKSDLITPGDRPLVAALFG